MNEPSILYPMFALAAWTGWVLLLVPLQLIRATKRQVVSAAPPAVSRPNSNLMNLFEAPVLFYVVSLILYVSATASAQAIHLAWTYVALRVVHSAIHLTYNKDLHRFLVFAASNAVLVALWILAGVALHAHTGLPI
jgi:hypothetical protein